MGEWAIIATWKMAYDGVVSGVKLLENAGVAGDAVEKAIVEVENCPYYSSVGYGGLPNERGVVELDAAFMDGDNLHIGAVGAIVDFKNPISIARRLSGDFRNNFLVGDGAAQYAHVHGFERRNMLTLQSKENWKKRVQEGGDQEMSAYAGHDTVCVLCLDANGSIAAGTSTSGIFMKKAGRIGDSPLAGPGFYADSMIGAAAATGTGEDITKGCLSYEVVRRMANGASPQEAASVCVKEFAERLQKIEKKDSSISVICLDRNGRYGVGTTIEFPFVVATSTMPSTVFLSRVTDSGTKFEKASLDWLENPTAD